MEKCKNCKYWTRKSKTTGECNNPVMQKELYLMSTQWMYSNIYDTNINHKCNEWIFNFKIQSFL